MDVWIDGMPAVGLGFILLRVRFRHGKCETAPLSSNNNNRHEIGLGGKME